MPTSKEQLVRLAERYGAPIGVPATPDEAKQLSKQLLKSFGEFFVEDLMLGGSTELGDATLTGNQELLDAATKRRSLFNEIMGLENGEQ